MLWEHELQLTVSTAFTFVKLSKSFCRSCFYSVNEQKKKCNLFHFSKKRKIHVQFSIHTNISVFLLSLESRTFSMVSLIQNNNSEMH